MTVVPLCGQHREWEKNVYSSICSIIEYLCLEYKKLSIIQCARFVTAMPTRTLTRDLDGFMALQIGSGFRACRVI